MPSYYPVFINVSDRICVVVGDGNVGEEKVIKLLDSDAKVRFSHPIAAYNVSGEYAMVKAASKNG